jgi:hypothetical protein
MNNWRLAASAILGAAVVVSCIVYVVSPVPPQRVEADQRLPPVLPSVTGHDTALSTNIQRPIAEDRITAFERAAEAILRRAQNARASADEPPLIAGHVRCQRGTSRFQRNVRSRVCSARLPPALFYDRNASRACATRMPTLRTKRTAVTASNMWFPTNGSQ